MAMTKFILKIKTSFEAYKRYIYVRHTKFLGVVFDDYLDWSNHISYINTKIAKGVGIICRAKKYFSFNKFIQCICISLFNLLR